VVVLVTVVVALMVLLLLLLLLLLFLTLSFLLSCLGTPNELLPCKPRSNPPQPVVVPPLPRRNPVLAQLYQPIVAIVPGQRLSQVPQADASEPRNEPEPSQLHVALFVALGFRQTSWCKIVYDDDNNSYDDDDDNDGDTDQLKPSYITKSGERREKERERERDGVGCCSVAARDLKKFGFCLDRWLGVCVDVGESSESSLHQA